MGTSLHAGQVCVADGTPLAGERIRRTLLADPGMGIVRHADAGLPGGDRRRRRGSGVRIPMRDVSAIAIRNAGARSLRPPERRARRTCAHDRAVELRARPGRRRVDGRDRRVRGRPGRRLRDRRDRLRRRPRLRRLPHAPAVRRLARERVRDEGHRRPVRGDRARAAAASRSSARALAEASDDEVLAQARGAARRDAARSGTTTFEGKTGYGLSRERRAARASRLGRELAARATGSTGAVRPRGARPATTRTSWMDEVERARAREARRRRARHLRRVGRVPNEDLERLGALAARAGRAAARARRAVRDAPLGAGRARRRRALGRPPRLPAPGRPRAAGGAPSAPRCCCPAPSSSAPSTRAPARALADAGAICVLATDFNPGTVADRLDAARSSGWPCAATAGACARRSPRPRSTPPGCSACARRVGSLEVGKRADLVVLDGPVEHAPVPLRPQPGAGRRRRAARSYGGADHPPAMVSAPTRTRSSATCAGRRALATDDFWGWRERDVRARRRARPGHDVRGRRCAPTRRCARPATARSASSTTSTTSPDGTPYADPNAMALAVAEPRRADAGLTCILLARRLPTRARRPGQRRFCDPDVDTFLARVDVALRERRTASPPTACARCRRAGCEAIAAYSDARDLVRHVHASEQPRELEECQAEHGCSPIELLHRTGLPRPAHQRRPRHPRVRARHRAARRDRHDRRLLPDHRGQPRRRLPARARLPRRRRPARDRHRREPRARPVRGGARAGDARPPRAAHPPRAARPRRRPVGRGRRATARTASASQDAGTIAVDLAHPRLAGVARDDLARAIATCGSADMVVR